MTSLSTRQEKDLSQEKGRILIVDDEIELSTALGEMLARQGFETRWVHNGADALKLFQKESFDIVLADLMMPGMDGITLLQSLLKLDSNLIGIIMTGQGSVQTAVEAMKTGAFDYILKPFKLNTVLTTLNHSLEMRRLRMDNIRLRDMVNIYELGQTLSITLDMHAIIQKTAEAARQQIEADEVTILVPERDNHHLIVACADGGSSERARLEGAEVPMEGSVAGWVATHKEPLILQGQVSDSRFTPIFPRSEIRSSISMPMVSGNALAGVINANITKRKQDLTIEQVRALAILVGIAASAMENARLYEQTQLRLRRLTSLRTIDMAIAASTDLRVTLDIILGQISAQLESDAAAIYLYDASTQMLEYAAGRGFHSHLLDHNRMLLGSGDVGLAALERRMVKTSDLSKADGDPLHEQLISREGMHTSFVMPLIVLGEVQGALQVFHRSPYSPNHEWLDFFEALAGQAAIAVNSARLLANLKNSNQQLLLAYNTTIEGWSRALDLRDHETEGHTQRVTEMTLRLVEALGGFDGEEILQIRRGSLLHDIGKMGVPDTVLLKPGRLTEEEWVIMRKHPEYAHSLLYPIPYLRKALDIPYSHHEWWDGSGYPRGLKSEQIPLAARIFAVVDVWDALSCDRPYRACWPKEKVLGYIREGSGTHFDPAVVEAFLKVAAQEKKFAPECCG